MRFILLIAATALIFAMTGGAALAAYPHTDFDSAPDACAACHRMHTATANNLLKDPTGSCKSCHADGLAADTDVENGTYIAVSGEDAVDGHIWGENGATLLGGGFDMVAATDATSKHNVDAGTSLTPPGKDAAAGAILNFTCTSCHSAHLDKSHPNQYRLLRYNINGETVDITWNGPWTTLDQTTPGGEIRAYTDKDFGGATGIQYYTNNYKSGISAWCAACHTHYLANPTGGSAYKVEAGYDAGDSYGGAERHRHSVDIPIVGRTVGSITYDLVTDMPLEDHGTLGRTNDDLLVCLSCHRAHGSSAAMHGQAVLADRGDVLPDGTDSMLLRADDRIMCRDCHNF